MTNPDQDDDNLIGVAFAMHSNPGAYALLLGAGVSASSGIPTAWGVLVDLVERVARLSGESPEDPVTWYREKFGQEARYETILERLAPTQIERQRLLRTYFEPDDENVREPTPAHRAVARLAKHGAVRLILTLNFDRLMESALRAEGIEPVVASTPADIRGLPPLHTVECCVIHLHGDYLNPQSMLNTELELHEYDSATTALLARILDDYGLVIAGWSSNYDPALRAAIATEYSSRMTLSWVEPATQSDLAAELLALKRGKLVRENADSAFGRLADAVASFAERRARHPLSVSVAVETTKRELSGHRVSISLHDALVREMARLRAIPEFHLESQQSDAEIGGYRTLVEAILEQSRVPAALVATSAYWGTSQTDSWWLREIDRLAVQNRGDGLVRLLRVRFIAASTLFYAAGVAAIGARRYDLLVELLKMHKPHSYEERDEYLATLLNIDATGVDHRLHLWPILAEVFAAADDPLESSWQEFEILRAAAETISKGGFSELARSSAQLERSYLTTKSVLKTSESSSPEVQQRAREASSDAWQEWQESIGRVVDSVRAGKPHVLVRDVRNDERYRSSVASRLANEIRAEGALHPLVMAGLASNPEEIALAIEAVSIAMGRVGETSAWARVAGRVGIVPSEVWIDSGLTPDELSKPHTAEPGIAGS